MEETARPDSKVGRELASEFFTFELPVREDGMKTIRHINNGHMQNDLPKFDISYVCLYQFCCTNEPTTTLKVIHGHQNSTYCTVYQGFAFTFVLNHCM